MMQDSFSIFIALIQFYSVYSITLMHRGALDAGPVSPGGNRIEPEVTEELVSHQDQPTITALLLYLFFLI